VFSAHILVLTPAADSKALALPGATSFITDVAVDAGGTVRRSFHQPTTVCIGEERARSAGGDLSDAVLTMPTSLAQSAGADFRGRRQRGAIASLGRDGAFVVRQLTHGWQEDRSITAQACVTDADEMVGRRDHQPRAVFALTR
jgi:hypothetical protein